MRIELLPVEPAGAVDAGEHRVLLVAAPIGAGNARQPERLRIKLARKALSISADCADACVVLGEAASTPDAALEWYQRGVDAGARVIGSERLTNERDLWDHLEARPYLRARLALARILQETHRGNEAIADKTIRDQLHGWEAAGYGHLPVCMAKTQYSFSTDPNLRGAPTGHTVPVREVRLAAGAGFVVAICGEIMTMPGLPSVPSSEKIFLNEAGEIEGLS